ncbi:hypothetical protein BH20ACT15_BH20ACT15_05780 [soil metagenome]
MVAQVTGELGGLHILRMVDVNMLGLLYCTREAMPAIRDSGGDGFQRGAAPGGPALEHPRHLHRARMQEQIGDLLEAEDIAEAIRCAVTQPERVNVNEILVRPTGQQR